MMTLIYILAAVVLLGLCIFIHELGHLLGGKMVGIKARVFSMGYGKGFIKKKIGETTYQVTLIPFGGYCQFYGENPGEERQGKTYEFLSAAPWRRIVTVAMGPLFNLFFGILIFFVMNMYGYEKETSRISIPEAYQSGKYIAAAYQAGIRSGDRIKMIDKKKITGFDDIQGQVLFSEGRELRVVVERGGKELVFTVKPALVPQTGRYAMGVQPYGEKVVIAGVLPGDVADSSGLKEMDVVLNIDGIAIKSPTDFIESIKTKANQKVIMTILRSEDEKKIVVTPRVNRMVTIDGDAVLDMEILRKLVREMNLKLNGETVYSTENFMDKIKKAGNRKVTLSIKENSITGKIGLEERGFIGVNPAIFPEMVTVQYGFGEGIVQAFVEPWEFIVMNVRGMGMLFSGKMNVRENVSGPIRIAKIAGDVAYYKGISAFILLMAKISIILMVMNLLPIPAVDGSHLVFFTIEAIRGKPLDQKIMERIQAVGVMILILLGVFVIVNDLSMLPAIQKFFN